MFRFDQWVADLGIFWNAQFQLSSLDAIQIITLQGVFPNTSMVSKAKQIHQKESYMDVRNTVYTLVMLLFSLHVSLPLQLWNALPLCCLMTICIVVV